MASSRDEPERSHEMRKYLTFRLDVHVKVDLAACLTAVAALVYLTFLSVVRELASVGSRFLPIFISEYEFGGALRKALRAGPKIDSRSHLRGSCHAFAFAGK